MLTLRQKRKIVQRFMKGDDLSDLLLDFCYEFSISDIMDVFRDFMNGKFKLRASAPKDDQ